MNIVERLRGHEELGTALEDAAAVEIERSNRYANELEQEIDRLRAALEDVIRDFYTSPNCNAVDIAQKGLGWTMDQVNKFLSYPPDALKQPE